MARLALQILVVVAATRLFGAAARRLGQPSVIGEMAAGLALGPSLFGALAPDAFASLFPAGSLGLLQLLSQAGVILFMFIVGLDFNWQQVRHRAHVAVVVSHVSILLPFLLGVLAAWALYASHAPAGVPFRAFALFMGTAMSITAFPVLARILDERQMLDTPIGSLALTCAAAGDVTAWVLLAVVVASVSGGGSLAAAAVMVGLTVAFGAALVVLARPLLAPILRAGPGQRAFRPVQIAVAVGMAAASAWVTNAIGIHAIFGAFLAGVTLPADDRLRAGLGERLERLGSVFLLPLFFAFTGLRVEIGLMDDWTSVGACLGIVALATIGKLGGSAVTARWMGMDWRGSIVLGALMNARGLVELIALNVGYDLGVISREMFTMLVVMALVTTAMTGPIVDRARRHAPQPA
jgi:Kef-type K+ transport system membrane component KefB